MELLEYQIEDIRRAVRGYVEKFAKASPDGDCIEWDTTEHERAELVEICRLIDHAYLEAVGRGLPK